MPTFLAQTFRAAFGLLALLAGAVLALALLLLGLLAALGLIVLSLLRGRRPTVRWVGPRPGQAFRRGYGRPPGAGDVIDIEAREPPGPPGPG